MRFVQPYKTFAAQIANRAQLILLKTEKSLKLLFPSLDMRLEGLIAQYKVIYC